MGLSVLGPSSSNASSTSIEVHFGRICMACRTSTGLSHCTDLTNLVKAYMPLALSLHCTMGYPYLLVFSQVMPEPPHQVLLCSVELTSRTIGKNNLHANQCFALQPNSSRGGYLEVIPLLVIWFRISRHDSAPVSTDQSIVLDLRWVVAQSNLRVIYAD